MATKIYGASDDLIESEGDVGGEVGHSADSSVLIFLSDGTVVTMRYGKADLGIWAIDLIVEGALFERLESCSDENADPNSDVLFLRDGIKWGYVATEWEKIK